MSINHFHHSDIEDNIYALINLRQYMASPDKYTEKAVTVTQNYLTHRGVDWDCTYNFYTETDYSANFAWIEDGYLHTLVLNCRKEN